MEIATTGTVVDIQITQSSSSELIAMVVLQDEATQQNEWFTLWMTPIGQLEFAPLWVVRSLNITLLRDALLNKQTVSIWHGNTSANVDMVEFGSA